MELIYKYQGKTKRYLLVNSIAQMSTEQRLAYFNFLMGVGDAYSIVPILWQIPLKELDQMDEEQRYWLYECILQDFEKPDGWIIQEFNGLQGPSDKMDSSTWAEFYSASTYLNRYRKKKNPTDLHKFLSCIYFDRSQEWSAEVPKNYTFFQKASAGFIFAAIQSFAAIEESLKKTFKHVFPAEEEEKPLAIATSSTEEITWLDITLSVCDFNPVLLEQYQQKNMYLVLKAINEKIKHHKKLKK